MQKPKKTKRVSILKKIGFGYSYILALFVGAFLISSVFFIVSKVAGYFFSPLLPEFDQERLGQLGDFLGGTLNPIFGFLTVCLLLWSISIQRTELKLTRKELKKTVKAQRDQATINRVEFERRQLENAANSCLDELDSLFRKNIFINPQKAALLDITKMGVPNTSWHDIIYDGSLLDETTISNFISVSTIEIEKGRIKHILLILAMNVYQLIKSDTYVSIESVREYWLNKVKDFIENCHILDIISDEELPTYLAHLNLVTPTKKDAL